LNLDSNLKNHLSKPIILLSRIEINLASISVDWKSARHKLWLRFKSDWPLRGQRILL